MISRKILTASTHSTHTPVSCCRFINAVFNLSLVYMSAQHEYTFCPSLSDKNLAFCKRRCQVYNERYLYHLVKLRVGTDNVEGDIKMKIILLNVQQL